MSARSLPPLAAVLALAVAAALVAAAPAAARCVDESGAETNSEPADAGVQAADPRLLLQTLVRDALARSHQVGASQMLAQAAEDDLAESRAATLPQVSLGLGAGPGGVRDAIGTRHSSVEGRVSINASQLLWDGGRSGFLTRWREQLAEAANQGYLSAREQLAMATVSLALERGRYRQHVVVYGQYVRKMSCLVEALDTIVRADRGRASELVQARKSLQQAELAQAQAQSQARAVELRLRRLVGDGLPPTQGLSALLLEVGDLNQLVAEVERSADVAAMTAQVDAAGRYADAVAAGGKPQLSWNASASATGSQGGSIGSTKNGNWSLGVTVNVPLWNPGQQPATSAARKRARATELQRAELLEQRRFRVAEVHEQTVASFDRVRRISGVLRDSDQLRNSTLQQWQQLGRRSLFDVIGAEAEHYNLRISYVNALTDGQQLNASLLSLGRGVQEWLR